ncbi:hypothetical protein PAM7066_03322 [Palleronia marisminoris]|uniref:Uncharacterized protein n=1 Tax=Palleronia marisminoris TaxID=315423 RepID=A0A1Y5TKH6_9RHOB|nr:hypothetical protein PAM7066_03322 [Palleronia marisminoris]
MPSIAFSRTPISSRLVVFASTSRLPRATSRATVTARDKPRLMVVDSQNAAAMATINAPVPSATSRLRAPS